MNEQKKPPSLRDFDYFSETSQGEARADVEQALVETVTDDADYERSQKRARSLISLLLTFVFLLVTAWFLYGYWDAGMYAFMPSQAPFQLGDVTEFTPAEIAHNAYVTVHGITEHRGLKQVISRGLDLKREEYWYFRLLGSRGVFIEVAPDTSKYGFTTEVTVSGRAVDPSRAPMYRELLRSYEDTFASENQPTIRIIQADVRPGEGRWPYGAALAILGCLVLANLVALARLIKRLRAC